MKEPELVTPQNERNDQGDQHECLWCFKDRSNLAHSNFFSLLTPWRQFVQRNDKGVKGGVWATTSLHEESSILGSLNFLPTWTLVVLPIEIYACWICIVTKLQHVVLEISNFTTCGSWFMSQGNSNVISVVCLRVALFCCIRNCRMEYAN